MPGFGTTDRTYENAVQLIRSLGADLGRLILRRRYSSIFVTSGMMCRRMM